jgi:hypothetical protein
MGCDAMYIGESPTFRRNISLTSTELKSKPSKKQAEEGVTTRMKIFLNTFTD